MAVFADVQSDVGSEKVQKCADVIYGWSLSDHLTVTLGSRGKKVVQKNPKTPLRNS